MSHLDYWYQNGGVMIMGYELYRRLANGFGIKNKKAKLDAYQFLVDPGPDIIGNFLLGILFIIVIFLFSC